MRPSYLFFRPLLLFTVIWSSIAWAEAPSWGYDFGSVTDENLPSKIRSAMSGDEIAMLHLGEAYRSGLLNGGFNFVESKRWYERAAAKGNPQAQLQLYHILSNGRGTRVDHESANVYLKASADQGFFEAQYYRAQRLLYQEPTKESRLEGVRLLLEASSKPAGFLARRGLSAFSGEYLGKLPPSERGRLCDLMADEIAMVSGLTGAFVALANCIDAGYRPKKNTEADLTAAQLVEEAARRGQIFFKMPSYATDATKLLVLQNQKEIEQLATAGHMHSLMVIADCFIFSIADGTHATCDDQEDGFSWNKLAAEKIGNIFFPEWLAHRYRWGLGIPSDVKQADRITVNLALKGSPANMARVAEEILDGNSDFGSMDFAVSLAEAAYGLDSAHSATLARVYLEGASASGFDHQKGVDLLYESFRLGDLAAGFQIATILETGLVVERNLEEALRIYRAIGSADYWFETYTDPTLDDKARVAVSRLEALFEKKHEATGQLPPKLNAGNYKALLIGNSEYDSLPNLIAPTRDVEALSSVLTNNFGFEVEVLLNATRIQTLEALNRYRKELKPQDNFLLYFAGHGTYDRGLDMGFWQPVEAEPDADYSWIDTTRVSRALAGFNSRNILVIADSCFSAAVLRGSSTPAAESASADLQSLMDRKTRLAFTSGGLEPVLDAGSRGGSSLFATEILSVLKDSRSPITATEVFNLVRGPVTKKSTEIGVSQVPEFSPLYRAGHDGGDFVFVPQPTSKVEVLQ